MLVRHQSYVCLDSQVAHEFPPFASDTLRTPPPGRLPNFSPPSGRDFTPRFAAPLRRRILEGEENFGAVAAKRVVVAVDQQVPSRAHL